MGSVDFNSPDFDKKVSQSTKKHGSNKFESSNKKDKQFANNFTIDKAKSMFKGSFMQSLIFLAVYFIVSGIIGNFIFLFTHPLYFLISVVSVTILYKVLKKFVFKKVLSNVMNKIKF